MTSNMFIHAQDCHFIKQQSEFQKNGIIFFLKFFKSERSSKTWRNSKMKSGVSLHFIVDLIRSTSNRKRTTIPCNVVLMLVLTHLKTRSYRAFFIHMLTSLARVFNSNARRVRAFAGLPPNLINFNSRFVFPPKNTNEKLVSCTSIS